uniref:Uncharacterized protein n=1 Tax=Fagus sylvatica TaxID=28930 RepID=A0A2N9EQ85_FAGSY
MAETEHVVSIEFDSREAGETSSGTTEEAQTQSISTKTTTLEAKFKTVIEAEKNAENQSSTPKIQKVVFLLRNTNEEYFQKYYEPRLVSFGPIHHGRERYDQGENYKRLLTSKFIKDSGKSMKDVYDKIEDDIKELRQCFVEEVTKKYDDNDLAWMLFVDGCAILQYIYIFTNHKFEESSIEGDRVYFAQKDLFMLENQLPYRLLTLLISLSNNKNELEKSIEKFIKEQIMVRPQRRKQQQDPNMVVHQKHIHLLDFLRTSLLDGQRSKVHKQKKKQNWEFNFSVQELQAAGIFVQCSKNKNSSLSDISFTTLFGCLGYLSLPPITVDDSTRSKLLNLIAYEMSLDFTNDYGITSYISFLDSLIDKADDIKILQKTKIIKNFLCNEEDAALIFNDIGTDLVPNFQIYSDVKIQIQNHYNKSIRTWLAQKIFTYFRSPTLMAFTGAFIGLVLTATQTWYAVNSPCDDLYKSLVLNLTGKR